MTSLFPKFASFFLWPLLMGSLLLVAPDTLAGDLARNGQDIEGALGIDPHVLGDVAGNGHEVDANVHTLNLREMVNQLTNRIAQTSDPVVKQEIHLMARHVADGNTPSRVKVIAASNHQATEATVRWLLEQVGGDVNHVSQIMALF